MTCYGLIVVMNTQHSSFSILLFTGSLISGAALGLIAMLQETKGAALVNNLTQTDINHLLHLFITLLSLGFSLGLVTTLLVRGISLVFSE